MKSEPKSLGVLTILGTPIGNMGDFSERGKAALASADVIVCEDSRRARTLCQQAAVPFKPYLVVNKDTEHSSLPKVQALLAEGKNLVLVSDAGMPSVSDPGAALVKPLADAGFEVTVVPGPSAVSASLAVSGFVGDRYLFAGFLPRKGKERSGALAELASSSITFVLFEAPPRLLTTLTDLIDVCGPAREAAVVRELTKLYEEICRGSLSSLRELMVKRQPKGEFCLVVAGLGSLGSKQIFTEDDLKEMLVDALQAGLSRRDAVIEVCSTTGEAKKDVYRIALEIEI